MAVVVVHFLDVLSSGLGFSLILECHALYNGCHYSAFEAGLINGHGAPFLFPISKAPSKKLSATSVQMFRVTIVQISGFADQVLYPPHLVVGEWKVSAIHYNVSLSQDNVLREASSWIKREKSRRAVDQTLGVKVHFFICNSKFGWVFQHSRVAPLVVMKIQSHVHATQICHFAFYALHSRLVQDMLIEHIFGEDMLFVSINIGRVHCSGVNDNNEKLVVHGGKRWGSGCYKSSDYFMSN